MSKSGQYTQSGVDIDAGQKAVNLMKTAIKATYNDAVLSDTGNFGGLYDASSLLSMQRPVLVASTDGVGTKTKVASKMGRWDTIGQDLVNHCINDILVQGAKPLFFLDYVACSRLDPEQIAAIVNGMALACKEAGCALLGGETAEMPGVYESGEVDVVGTIVGVLDHDGLIDGSAIKAGNVILGLPSTGLHTNGYSLARKVLQDLDWTQTHPDLGVSIGDALLATHHNYLSSIKELKQSGVNIHGLAHITGGGFIDNVPRILPEGVGAKIRIGTWPTLPIFTLIQQQGDIDTHEMFRVFNMGIGMMVILSEEQVEKAQSALSIDNYVIGKIVDGEKIVTLEMEQ